MKSILFSVMMTFSLGVIAQDFIVFKSKGGQFPPGMVVSSGDKIQLGVGEYLKIIAPSGKMVKVQGPYNEPLGNMAKMTQKGISDTLKALVSAQQKHTKDMGVTRDSSGIIQAARKIGWVPEPWVVNISYNGDKCVKEGEKVRFWRAEEQNLKLKISMAKEFEAVKVLNKGESYINAPENLPIMDGAKYQFEYGDKLTQSTIHLIPNSVTDKTILASWLKESGCRAQAVALLSQK